MIAPYDGADLGEESVAKAKAGTFLDIIGTHQLNSHNVLVVGDSPQHEGKAALMVGEKLGVEGGLTFVEVDRALDMKRSKMKPLCEYPELSLPQSSVNKRNTV